MLTATAFHAAGSSEKGAMVLRDPGVSQEVEKGLLLLIASDTPGLQVRSALFLFFSDVGKSNTGEIGLTTNMENIS